MLQKATSSQSDNITNHDCIAQVNTNSEPPHLPLKAVFWRNTIEHSVEFSLGMFKSASYDAADGLQVTALLIMSIDSVQVATTTELSL